MMNLKFLLAGLLLFAPAVYGCVVFQAALSYGDCDRDTLYGVITDNGFEICKIKSLPIHKYTFKYNFTCLKEKYYAVFDVSTGLLDYTTDHGAWVIGTTKAWGVENVWTACPDWLGCSGNDSACWAKVETCPPKAPPPPPKAPAPAPKAPVPAPKAPAPAPKAPAPAPKAPVPAPKAPVPASKAPAPVPKAAPSPSKPPSPPY